jgi:sugar lactone lactonase YvrE
MGMNWKSGKIFFEAIIRFELVGGPRVSAPNFAATPYSRSNANRRMKCRPASSPVGLGWLRCFVFIAFLCIFGVGAAEAQVPTIATFAGGGLPAAGPATNAGISLLGGIARDASGNFYIVSYTGTIVKMDPAGNLSVFAGTGPCCFSGDGGPATSAKLSIMPTIPAPPVKTDPAGNVYIVEFLASVIRRIDHTTGIITTVAGTPYSTGFSGAGGPATSAQISPDGIAFDAAGDLYISDYNGVVWRVDHVTQLITIVAGNGTLGYSGDGGLATSAQLGYPTALAFDAAGDLFIADSDLVREVNVVTQIITTVAGGGSTYPPTGVPATQALLYDPTGLAFDPGGNLLIADSGLNAILRENKTTQIITVIAGNFTRGFSGDGGPATSAQLSGDFDFGSMDLAVDPAGDIFFTDTLNYRVRRIDASTNVITTVVGNGTVGDGGPATSALLFAGGIAFDSSGNAFVADVVNDRVRRVDGVTSMISTVAGRDVESTPPPSGNGDLATAAQTINPQGMAVDSLGDLFFAEDDSMSVRYVDASTGIINVFAGTGFFGFSGDGGPATSAKLDMPKGIAADAAGNIYIADTTNNVIRRVDASTHIISTVAGNTSILSGGRPAAGYGGDGGLATVAQLSGPRDVFVDAGDNLFISDTNNAVIRRVDAVTQIITTVAGNYSLGYGFAGDNGPATAAQLWQPQGLALDAFGNLYFADSGNYRVRQVNAVTGIITTLAGTGTFTFSGDGGPAASASLWPYLPGMAVFQPKSGGNIQVLVLDGTSGRVRQITIPPVPAVFLNPASLTFGSQMAGTFSAAQLITIANSGTGALNVSNVSLAGTDPNDFVITSGGTCAGTMFSLAPTKSCTIAVEFAPIAAGVRLAAVSLTDNASGSPQVAAVQGTGTQAPPTQEIMTLALSPTAPNQFSFDSNTHNFTVQYPAGTAFSGVKMTVKAAQTTPAAFQGRLAGTPFANATCIVYDGEDGYCEDYQVTCTNTAGQSITCPNQSTATINVKTSYDTHQPIFNPGFLTTPIGTNNWVNIFTAFYLQRIDPTTGGRTTGFSEFFAVDLGVTNPEDSASLTFLPPLQQSNARIFPSGTLIPVAFQLNSIGRPSRPVVDATAAISLVQLTDASGKSVQNIILNKSSVFRFVNGEYVYELTTFGYAPGIYDLTVYGDTFAAQQVEFTIPTPTFGAKLQTQVQSFMFDSSTKQYVATFLVSNIGKAAANGVIVTASNLDLATTTTILPVGLGDIGAGSSATVTLTYPSFAGRQGLPAILLVFEAYAGGLGDALLPVKLP